MMRPKNLVEVVGFEPTHPVGTDLQSAAPLQLRRTSIYLVDRKRIELLPETCKAPVLPLSLTAQILVDAVRFELTQN